MAKIPKRDRAVYAAMSPKERRAYLVALNEAQAKAAEVDPCPDKILDVIARVEPWANERGLNLETLAYGRRSDRHQGQRFTFCEPSKGKAPAKVVVSVAISGDKIARSKVTSLAAGLIGTAQQAVGA